MFLNRRKKRDEDEGEGEASVEREGATAAEETRAGREKDEEEEEDEDGDDDDDDEDEQERDERMRLAQVHAKLSEELERACTSLGVVEDSAMTNKETRDIYGQYGASLDQSSGLVSAVASRRFARRMALLACIVYFAICILWVFFSRLPLIYAFF